MGKHLGGSGEANMDPSSVILFIPLTAQVGDAGAQDAAAASPARSEQRLSESDIDGDMPLRTIFQRCYSALSFPLLAVEDFFNLHAKVH